MTTILRFDVPTPPVPKARPRMTRSGQVYTDSKTEKYETLFKKIAWRAREKAGIPIFTGPVAVEVTAYLAILKSWSKKKKAAAMDGDVLPTVTPDLDNICKSALDACNKVVYEDDKQIVNLSLAKRYGHPGVCMVVRSIDTENE